MQVSELGYHSTKRVYCIAKFRPNVVKGRRLTLAEITFPYSFNETLLLYRTYMRCDLAEDLGEVVRLLADLDIGAAGPKREKRHGLRWQIHDPGTCGLHKVTISRHITTCVVEEKEW